MKLFSKSNIKKLEEKKRDFNISVFVPTYRAHKDDQNLIAFKNAIKEVHHKLAEHGYSDDEIKKLIRPLTDLQSKEGFWGQQSDGLAVFMNETYFELHTVPVHFEPISYVGKEFYVKPMLPLINQKNELYLMTISSNQIALFECEDYSISELDISKDFPQSVKESNWHINKKSTLQSHGMKSSDVHGHGAGNDKEEEAIKRHFRDVNTGLESFFKGKTKPLLLAGVDHIVRLFKETFNYEHILDEHISGNHDNSSLLELHERAMMIMSDKNQEDLESDFRDLKEIMHTARTETEIDKILKAVVTGKVHTLYLNGDHKDWGSFDPNKLEVKHTAAKTNGQIDLVNTAALKTILNGGEVKMVYDDLAEQFESNVVAYYRH